MIIQKHFHLCTFKVPGRGIAAILIFGFLLPPSETRAQEPNRWKTYTSQDGSLEDIHKVVQDSRGFLWTDWNTYRFDGLTFTKFRRNSKDSLGIHLVPGDIRAINTDDAGDVWIEDGKGIIRYDFEKDGFITYKSWARLTAILRSQRNVGFSQCMAGNKHGLWVGAESAGLFYLDPGKDEIQNFLNVGKDSASTSDLSSIHAIIDKGAYLVCATHKGTWKFDKEKKMFSKLALSQIDTILSAGLINEVFKAKDHYWFRIQSSDPDKIGPTMVKTDSKFLTLQRIVLPVPLYGILSGNPPNLAVDNNDVFWIHKAGQGVLRYDPASNSSTYYENEPGNPNSLPEGNDGIFVDRDQNVWVATGNGLSRLVKSRMAFSNYTETGSGTIVSLKSKDKEYVVSAAGNELWTAEITSNSNARSFKFRRTDVTPWLEGIEGIVSIAGGRNNLWLTAGRPNTPFFYVVKLPLSPDTGLPDGRATWIDCDPPNARWIDLGYRFLGMEDGQQNLWVAKFRKGGRHGLDKVEFTRSGEVKGLNNYRHNPADSNSICEGALHVVYDGGKDSVWVGTLSGLDLLHQGRFQHILQNTTLSVLKTSKGSMLAGTDEGLLEGKIVNGQYRFSKVEVMGDHQCKAMEEDGLKRFWITTTHEGLFVYNPRDQTVQNFTTDDGIQSDNFSGYSTQTSNGIMVFGGGGAVLAFDPLALTTSQTIRKPLITRLKVSNKQAVVMDHPAGDDDFVITKNIGALSELVLDYTHNFFALDFISTELAASDRISYAYKLEGMDEDWVQTDSKNAGTFPYMNLTSGEYTFKVKAISAYGGGWSEETALPIVILPPPWRTWWAYAGYSLLAAGLLVLARRNIVQRERLKSNLKLEHLELEKAQEVDRVKTSFFTNISHEFRTPLTLIKGPVQNLLEEFADNPKVRERLKMVQRNSDLLLRLINQLLDLAKLETGTLKVEKSEGNLFAFIRAVASSFESFARQKGVALSIEVPAGSQAALFDKDKLETILINLINNAVKFTPSGGIVTVHAQIQSHAKAPTYAEAATAGKQSRQELTLLVSDTGIGIPPDQQSKVFERFHQVSEAHKEVGTGIGLSLVKELVALMGGEISVKSAVGAGSEFMVKLPIEVLTDSNVAAALFTSDQHSVISSNYESEPPITEHRKPNTDRDEFSKKPHILVVEDNGDLRAFIIDSLGTEFQFLEAENGVQGLEKATTEVPDLIISDVMMPEMDGITMAGKIKGDVRTSHIPLILLTARSTEDSKLSGLQSGADDYLTKPFNKNELLLKVRNGVSRQQKLREKLRAELLSTAPKVEVMSEDEKFLASVKEKILERLSDEQLSVESLADDIGMSRVQLYRKVTALTGMSVNELIRKLRLQRAAQLLSQNWGPVSQVAYEVGFSNLSYFSKVFKEEFGVLPSEFSVEKG